MNSQLRHLPQIDTLLQQPHVASLVATYSHDEVCRALRETLDQLRRDIRGGGVVGLPDFASEPFAHRIADRIKAARQSNLRPVINATGIIIHTNLGRARLAPEALQAMDQIAARPSNLELNLKTGKRGSRYDHAEALICQLTGAEAALIVNNCAAAVVLALMGTAAGRKVIASRGELIEIGGSFRLPDVIAQSGAELKEVGATNKTRLSDYADAVDEDTAVLLKSHTSNFRIVGFTSAPSRNDLAQLAAERDLILMEDLGSGVLIDLAPFGLRDEPVVADILKAGVDLVMFSGDKLLGGPQAGIIAGRADIIAGLRKHPLLRALRIDKLSLAALEATLRLYLPPHDPLARVPVLRALSQPLAEVEARAQRLAGSLAAVKGVDVEVMASAAYVGGGSLPQQDLNSFSVVVASAALSAETLADRLRAGVVPIVGRIHQGKLWLDMRTVMDDELPDIVAALGAIAAI
ncbi:L-seryl-tRNA(Sec) selenium transferase [Sulfitobacter sp.]|uniref:L-seryl-tRNA(Sec) selenium transferase n=1 Tax=Sulfitobacter sp. TaxID=1903071 RepID=UPI00272D35B7|nr:L-seryl-tRNA(Sec) selenium transferase [Sulfitobacter sp.]